MIASFSCCLPKPTNTGPLTSQFGLKKFPFGKQLREQQTDFADFGFCISSVKGKPVLASLPSNPEIPKN